MLAHRVFAPFKRHLPLWITRPIRNALTALLTPVHFAYSSGHFRSSLAGSALSRSGCPIPWYSLPAVDFLSRRRYDGRRVLEFGGGNSTLWWAARAAQVVTLESDERWIRRIESSAPANVSVHLVSLDACELPSLLQPGIAFDVIVIDGLDRHQAAQRSVALLKDDGAILLDNSEGEWGPPGSHRIIQLFAGLGFSRVDFYGYAAGNIAPQCTSLFFRRGCFLLNDQAPPSLRDA